MDFHQLNGLTPKQLHVLIMNSPIGFSAEDGSIQYLGKQIQLHNGCTMLSEQISSHADSEQLFERLVTLQPDLERQLPSSKAEAIQMVAKNLVKKFRIGALEKSPTKEVLFAVFLQCQEFGSSQAVQTLFSLNSLNATEKLRIMLASAEKLKWPSPVIGRYLTDFFPLSIRLKETKKLFQRLHDMSSMAEEVKEVNEYMTELKSDATVKDSLQEIREIFKSENNEIANQLLNEIDLIEKKFIPKVDGNGLLSSAVDRIHFKAHTRRLLFLYVASCNFSQKADIAELTSYIRFILHYTNDSDNIWHIVKELTYLS